jgi:hypothetical protein
MSGAFSEIAPVGLKTIALPLGGLRAAADRRGAHAEHLTGLLHRIASVQEAPNLCIVQR